MSAPTADLIQALAAYTGTDLGDVEEVVSTTTIARLFGVSRNTIVHAISTGKLPAAPIRDDKGAVITYRVSLLDAFLIWGHRLNRKEEQ